MENVMTKGFCELNENEMMGVEGGWSLDIHIGNWVDFHCDEDDAKAAANWYKNTYVPAAEDFGAKVHQRFFN